MDKFSSHLFAKGDYLSKSQAAINIEHPSEAICLLLAGRSRQLSPDANQNQLVTKQMLPLYKPFDDRYDTAVFADVAQW
jgi:hypothetical protein